MKTKYGYTVAQITEWRCREHEASRPCNLIDFFNAHGIAHSDMSNQPKDTSQGQTAKEEKE